MKTAVLVDGGFYLKRYMKSWRDKGGSSGYPSASDVADAIHSLALYDIKTANKHLSEDQKRKELYRILFYDCEPFLGGSTNPVSNHYTNYSKSAAAVLRTELHEQLEKKRRSRSVSGELPANLNGFCQKKRLGKYAATQITKSLKQT